MSIHFPPQPYRVLLIWPQFPASFWSMQATIRAAGRKATLPPLGLITVAAMCPKDWELRLVDENVESLTDQDLGWADLIMISAMEIQSAGVAQALRRAREMGRRTVVGGPYASSHTQELMELADHVVSGEVEEDFAAIATALQQGTAEPLYALTAKPDVTTTPRPRFDLLKLGAYAAMSVQFSRGCPFQCEFCDIIVLYGRKPRTKTPQQLTAELDALLELGWTGEVFMVDDNFIGNQVKALALLAHMQEWQRSHHTPMSFYTEASVNLAARPNLMEAMVRANFQYVFLGIETPSGEALQETGKLQNTRQNLVESIRTIQQNGLWVMGGFIVGFDCDQEDIFERQWQFIEDAAIPWAMVGMLQALRHTALADRLRKEGRLFGKTSTGNNLSLPNFRTSLSRKALVEGYAKLLERLYSPQAYFDRVLRSLEFWRTQPGQTPPKMPLRFQIRGVLGSLYHIGWRSNFRGRFWSSLFTMLKRYWKDPTKVYLGFTMLITSLHMIGYARTLIDLYRHADIGEDPTPESSSRPGDSLAVPRI